MIRVSHGLMYDNFVWKFLEHASAWDYWSAILLKVHFIKDFLPVVPRIFRNFWKTFGRFGVWKLYAVCLHFDIHAFTFIFSKVHQNTISFAKRSMMKPMACLVLFFLFYQLHQGNDTIYSNWRQKYRTPIIQKRCMRIS